jgi:hypothetical protein
MPVGASDNESLSPAGNARRRLPGGHEHRVKAPLDKSVVGADNGDMRHIPTSLKLVALLSLVAEATAAALVFWHTGPRAR